jgi:hypothetical protein
VKRKLHGLFFCLIQNPVGASLLAIAVGQATSVYMNYRYRQQAGSHI